MDSPMDWTPAAPTRRLKRRHDGTMVLESPFTPYGNQYMPGGWPNSPPSPDQGVFARDEPDSFALTAAKRICYGLTACMAFTTQSVNNIIQHVHLPRINPEQHLVHARVSVNNIVRRVRNTQLRPARPVQRARARTPPLSRQPPSTPQRPTVPNPFNARPVLPPPQEVAPQMVKTPVATKHITPPTCPQLRSPYPDLGPRLVVPPTPVSPAAAQLRTELKEAVIESESEASSTCDGNWLPNTIINLPTTESPQSDISSNVPPTPEDVRLAFEKLSQQFAPTPTVVEAPKTPTPHPIQITPKSSPHSVEKGTRTTRAVSRRLQDIRDARNYTLTPLSQEWEKRVHDALCSGYGDYTVSDFSKVVAPPHLEHTGTAGWLNDEVVNGYLKVVCEHGNKDLKPGSVPRFHAFNSFFMKNLLDPKKGPASVKRWAAKAKIGGSRLLDVQRIFIPINSGAHWTIAVISPEIRNIAFYNSMSGDGARYNKKIIDWLKLELGEKHFDEEEWNVENKALSPQQGNFSDCGVFTITTAKQIMLGNEVMSYGPDDIPTQRKRIVAELINGGLIRSS